MAAPARPAATSTPRARSISEPTRRAPTSGTDLEANPPRIIDRVVVGDGPEGLAMSPKGDLAVAAILRGSNMKNAFFHQKNGSLTVLKIDGKKGTKTRDIELGGYTEGGMFSQ